jgi:hypothetical protein
MGFRFRLRYVVARLFKKNPFADRFREPFSLWFKSSVALKDLSRALWPLGSILRQYYGSFQTYLKSKKRRNEMRNWRGTQSLFLVLVFASLLFSCSTTQKTFEPMALTPESKAVDLSRGSVGIMIIRTENIINPGYPVVVQQVKIFSPENEKAFDFKLFDSKDPYSKTYVDNFISMPLPPGVYELTNFSGIAQKEGAELWLVPARFSWNLRAQFQLVPGKLIYLGRIIATNQERKGNETTSGGSIPLIPQAASGFNRGTFSVKLIDAYQEDIANLTEQFPWLREHQIEKSLLNILN